MKKIILIIAILSLVMLAACAKRQVANPDDYVGQGSSVDEQTGADTSAASGDATTAASDANVPEELSDETSLDDAVQELDTVG